MPVYNTESYVAEAIESILQQTFRDFEFIIVDDGSTDNTPTIMESYACSDERIHVIHNPVNRGPAACRNAGIAYAQGEYIALMDADDSSQPQRLATQAAYLDDHTDIDVVGCSVLKIDQTGKPLGVWKLPGRDRVIRWHILFRSSRIFCNPTLMIRRDVFDRVGYFNESIYSHDDLELWTRFFDQQDLLLTNLSQILLHYRVHQKSITRSVSDEQNTSGRVLRTKLISGFLGEPVNQHVVTAYETPTALTRLEILKVITTWFSTYRKFTKDFRVNLFDALIIYREILARTVGYVGVGKTSKKAALKELRNHLRLKDRFAIVITSLYAKARNPRA